MSQYPTYGATDSTSSSARERSTPVATLAPSQSESAAGEAVHDLPFGRRYGVVEREQNYREKRAVMASLLGLEARHA